MPSSPDAAQALPPDRTDLAVLRIVCRHDFPRDMADLFLQAMHQVTDDLQAATANAGRGSPIAFHHYPSPS